MLDPELERRSYEDLRLSALGLALTPGAAVMHKKTAAVLATEAASRVSDPEYLPVAPSAFCAERLSRQYFGRSH